ncbi:MAG: hypothetical protein JW820_07605 [Spirochaetales bacterium]|nr:hypothetical protein [Spirochaetales bacterium]
MKRRRTLDRLLPRGPETRRMVLVGAGLFVGSAVVTLIIVLTAGGRPSGPSEAVPEPAEQPAGEVFGAVGLGDLLLAPSDGEPQGPAWGSGGAIRDLREARSAGHAPPYLLRPPLERWSREQVQRYWIPLNDIAVDRIRQENDRRMHALFEEVP